MSRSAIMGVVNVTPDSFSDGGKAFAQKDALRQCAAFVDAGVDIIDLGAESTRPGATPLSADEEWARLAPVVTDIATQAWRHTIKLSVDTRHPETAARALAAGVEMINDVSGLTQPAMLDLVADHHCSVVAMHALSIPADKAVTLPEHTDMVDYMRVWAAETTERALSAGISADRLMFDPGLGFGKTARQSWQLLGCFREYAERPEQWLIGHSRKSLFNLISDTDAAQRDPLTLAISAMLMVQGAGVLRVHDVPRHVALRHSL